MPPADVSAAAGLHTAMDQFEDDTARAGERRDATGLRFNALHAHEELARLLPHGVGAIASLLHERCRFVARAAYSDLAAELWTAQGRDGVLACGLQLSPILRLEPAELLETGDTRLHWVDVEGGRHALSIRWSSDGLALRVVLVDSPPISHREWAALVESGDELGLRALLTPDVTLHDATDESTTTGCDAVLHRLLRWSAGARGRVHRLSRAEHPAVGFTRLHLLGSWPLPEDLRSAIDASLREEGELLIGGAAAAAPMNALHLQQETLQWSHSGDAPRAARPPRAPGGDSAAAAAAEAAAEAAHDGTARVQTIWWRSLLLPPGSVRRSQRLPLDLYRAAALAGSQAVLCSGGGGAALDGLLAAEGDANAAKVHITLHAGRPAEDAAPPDGPGGGAREAAAAPLVDMATVMEVLRRADDGVLLEAVALGDFEPAGWGEMALTRGETVSLVQDAPAPEGWAIALRRRAQPGARPDRGLVPATYVELVRPRAREEEGGDAQFWAGAEAAWALAGAEGSPAAPLAPRAAPPSAAETRGGRPAQGREAGRAAAAAPEEEGEAGEEEEEVVGREGVVVLSEGPHAGEARDLLAAHEALVRWQHEADRAACRRLFDALEEAVELRVCVGDADGAPLERLVGRAAVREWFQREELRRTRGAARARHPAARRADGRTSVLFSCVLGAEGRGAGRREERHEDLVRWSAAGRVAALWRVRAPPPSHREWLLAFHAGDAPRIARCVADGAAGAFERRQGARTARGRQALLDELLLPSAARAKGHVLHIGRTRHLPAWPGATSLPPDSEAAPAPAGALVTQAVLIGDWRPQGGKWYAERAFALEETLEWRDGKVVRLRREQLPPDHPHARPVWARLRAKQRAQRKAERAAAERAALAERPRLAAAWSDQVAKPMVRSRKGLLVAATRPPG